MKLDAKTLILLVGPIASGKTTLRKKFIKAPALCADDFRELISGDAGNQEVSKGAFELLFHAAEVKMQAGFPVVVDNLNHLPNRRKPFLDLAKKYGYKTVAIVFAGIDLAVCLERNKGRERFVPEQIVSEKYKQFCENHPGREEGFDEVFDAKTITEPIVFQAESVDTHPEIKKAFVIGDVHGCFKELVDLLHVRETDYPDHVPVFAGDLVDRGPTSKNALFMAKGLVDAGKALCVQGNHDNKLYRWLKGNKVKLGNGLEDTVKEFNGKDLEDARGFLSDLPYYLVLDGGKLVVCHAGIQDWMIGRKVDKTIRAYCLYGEPKGIDPETKLPIRVDWAAKRKATESSPMIVYGHTARPEPYRMNKTICVDTGCVFGRELTAYVYPEDKTVSVKAKEVYSEEKVVE